MISVITCTIRENYLDNVFNNYTSQVVEEKELIIILNKDSMDSSIWKKRAEEYDNISIYQLPEETATGDCQNFGVHKAKYDIIAKFDDDDYYSPYYLKGQLQAFQNNNAHIVGKRACYYYLEANNTLVKTNFNKQNCFVNKVVDSSMMFRKEIFDHFQFQKLNSSFDSKFQKQCHKQGFKIYATDPYNFTVVRRADKNSHTWQISDGAVKRYTKKVAKMDDYRSYVTKPI